MTAFLLDTNAFAMALIDDPRLPDAARARMQDADRLAVSVISLYEIGQKVRLGKWPEMSVHIARLDQTASANGFNILPLTGTVALTAALLDWDHRDPFDRMIAAVSQQEGLPVISSDAAFDAIDVSRHWLY